MKKEEFLRQLEELLREVSEDERNDALAYYRSYFEDAGEGQEQEIIAELESPEKVAEIIKRDLGMIVTTSHATGASGGTSNQNTGNAQNKYSNVAGAGTYYNNTSGTNQKRYNYGNTNQGSTDYTGTAQKKDNTTTIVLVVIIAVLTSPIWLSLLGIIMSIAVAVVAVLVAIAIAVVAMMVALVGAGCIIIGAGLGTLFGGGIAIGLGLLGAGLLVLSLGILAVVATVWIFGEFLPWAFKGLYQLCKRPFEKRGERKTV